MPRLPKLLRRTGPWSGPFDGRTETLASRDNRWLKAFRAALRGSGSTEEDWVGVEGAHLVEEAMRSRAEVAALLVSDSGERHLERIATAPLPKGVKVFRTSDRLFTSVTGTETPQGVAALLRPRRGAFDDLLRGGVPLIVVLVGVQDPGNVGTVLRSAEAFGATGAIATRGTADPWSPKVLRASAGSALRLPIVSGMAPAVALAQLRIAGVKIFAGCSGGDSSSRGSAPAQADLSGPVALLVGNEGAGLPPEVERAADGQLQIPIVAGIDSLNAAVAASVLLYEASRQRGRQV